MGQVKRQASEAVALPLTRPLGENTTPQEFEIYMKEQIESWGHDIEGVEIKHLDRLSGYDGDYDIDVTARFKAFGGMKFLCLFECKRHKYPVKRRDFQQLLSKLHSVGAHKAIMVSLSGFQAGAIAFAQTHGIAAITIASNNLAMYASMFPAH